MFESGCRIAPAISARIRPKRATVQPPRPMPTIDMITPNNLRAPAISSSVKPTST
jgi:hypothetical protein